MISPRLSRENIVAVAIEMADEEGLASVTLRGIAERLAVHVTSLYNYVPTSGHPGGSISSGRMPGNALGMTLDGARRVVMDSDHSVVMRAILAWSRGKTQLGF